MRSTGLRVWNSVALGCPARLQRLPGIAELLAIALAETGRGCEFDADLVNCVPVDQELTGSNATARKTDGNIKRDEGPRHVPELNPCNQAKARKKKSQPQPSTRARTQLRLAFSVAAVCCCYLRLDTESKGISSHESPQPQNCQRQAAATISILNEAYSQKRDRHPNARCISTGFLPFSSTGIPACAPSCYLRGVAKQGNQRTRSLILHG